jgi:hypothetical protein
VLLVALALWLGSILTGHALVPDTAVFSSGGGWYSSPLLALIGRWEGNPGVRAVACFGVVMLTAAVWKSSRQRALRGALVAVVLVAGPWSDALQCAGSDALAAGVILLALSRRPSLAPIAAAVHVAGGLAAVVAIGGRRWLGLNYAMGLSLAGIAEIVVMRVGVAGSSTYATEYQWRYLLPAVAAGVLPSLKRKGADAITSNPLIPTAGGSEYLSV